MKKNYFLSALTVLLFSVLNAQVEDYLVLPSGTLIGIAIDGSDMYISDVGGAKIHKLDMTQPTPGVTDFIDGVISFPGLIREIDNKLYIPQLNNLISVDFNEPLPNLTGIALTNFSFGVAKKGDYLYTTYRNAGKVVKFDLTQTLPAPIDVVTGLGSFLGGLQFIGDDLYIARGGDGKISKIDVTETNPTVIDIIADVSPIDLLLDGDDLYFSDAYQVSRVDITQTNPSKEIIVDNLEYSVWGLAISDNYLYMAQQLEHKILRLDLNTLSKESIDDTTKIEIYPNPTSSIINITNNDKLLNYKIFDLTGKLLLKGEAKNEIDIIDLNPGVYLVEFDGSETQRIIKN